MQKRKPIKLVRSRKPGGGRKTKYGEKTRLVTLRMPASIPSDFVQKILDLRVLLAHWDAEIEKNQPTRTSNARYWHAKRMLNDIRSLGF